MNELEMLRDQLIGMRAQLNGALKSIEQLLRRMEEPEPEPEPPRRPRWLGDGPTPEDSEP